MNFAAVLFLSGRVAGAAVAKLAYAVGLKSTGVFPVVGSSPTSRTIPPFIASETPLNPDCFFVTPCVGQPP
jgi:hypothetical protein